MNRATLVAILVACLGVLVALMMATSGLSVSAAPTAEDLSGSTLSVSETEALQGDTIKYTVYVSNSGDTAANPLMLTATIPTGASYVNGTMAVTDSSAAAELGSSESAQELTWEAVVSAGGYATLSFDVEIGAATPLSSVLTTTVMLDAANGTRSMDAATTVVEETDSYIYLPVVMREGIAPTASVSGISASGSSYQWQVNWNNSMPNGAYQVQESQDPAFSNVISTVTVNGVSHSFNHAASNSNIYYYRVRSLDGAGSAWSNVVEVVNAYRDDFNDSSSGWLKVRQDLDDTQNELSYTPAGYLKMWVRGRWDYFVSSPLKPTPAGDYSVSSRVRYDGAGNLNTYGFIVGADWNGEQCPTLIMNPNPTRSSSSEVVLDPNEVEESHIFDTSDGSTARELNVDNCFNHYWRVMLMWIGNGTVYQLQVKRIDFHEAPKNSGRGPEFVSFIDVPVIDQNGWNDWQLDVRRSTGDFTLFSNGTSVANWSDTSHINDVWWGLWASTDEYPGSDPLYDFVEVKPLP